MSSEHYKPNVFQKELMCCAPSKLAAFSVFIVVNSRTLYQATYFRVIVKHILPLKYYPLVYPIPYPHCPLLYHYSNLPNSFPASYHPTELVHIAAKIILLKHYLILTFPCLDYSDGFLSELEDIFLKKNHVL